MGGWLPLIPVRPLWARRRLLHLAAYPSRGNGLKPPKLNRARGREQRALRLATSKSQTRNQRLSFLKLETSTRKPKPEARVDRRPDIATRHCIGVQVCILPLSLLGPEISAGIPREGQWHAGCHRRILGSARPQTPGDQHTKCRRGNLVILTDTLPASPGRSATHGVPPTHPRF